MNTSDSPSEMMRSLQRPRACCGSIGRANVSRVSLDGRFRYARNYARDRPSNTQNHPPASQAPKKNPSASPRLTEGFLSARLLDRPVW